MSRDLFVFKLDDPQVDADGKAYFPEDFSPQVIGPLGEIRQKINESIPGINWADPGRGTYESPEASLEIYIGDEDPCTQFTISCWGNATPLIVTLINATGWRICETGSGGWMHMADDPDEGRRQFEAYHDHAVGAAPKLSGFKALVARLFRR